MTEIFNSYYAEKSFRGMCTVQKYHWHFSLLTISFIFVLGFAFGSDSCVSKIGICLLCEIRFSLKSLSYEQPLFSFYYRPVVPGCAGCAMAHPDFGRSLNSISSRGTDYNQLKTTGTPGFSDLPTALYYAHCTGCITPCFWIPTINQYLQFQGMIVFSSSAN